MKKLVILAMIGMISTFTSCTNDSNESITVQEKPINKTESRGEFDYLAKDGNLYYVSPTEVYYMGEQLKEDTSEEAQFVNQAVKESITNPNSEFSRAARTQCSFHFPDGTYLILTQVYGSGQGSTYWVTTISPNGDMYTMQNPGVTCNDIRYNISQDNIN